MTRWIPAIAVACGGGGKDDELGFPRACDESRVDGDCILFSGEGWIASDVTGTCGKGVVIQECPRFGIGSCTVDAGDDFEAITTFYSPFWNDADAVGACSSNGGTWVQSDR